MWLSDMRTYCDGNLPQHSWGAPLRIPDPASVPWRIGPPGQSVFVSGRHRLNLHGGRWSTGRVLYSPMSTSCQNSPRRFWRPVVLAWSMSSCDWRGAGRRLKRPKSRGEERHLIAHLLLPCIDIKRQSSPFDDPSSLVKVSGSFDRADVQGPCRLATCLAARVRATEVQRCSSGTSDRPG